MNLCTKYNVYNKGFDGGCSAIDRVNSLLSTNMFSVLTHVLLAKSQDPL